ncbi:MAG: ATP-binding protein [Phycisphaerae bacterium]|nr:ATP-binding protein [Phycisphaerae bacterium]
MTNKKQYILPAGLGLIGLLAAAAIPAGGTGVFEVLLIIAAVGVTAYIGWFTFIDRKFLLAQFEGLKNDYKGQREKASQCVKETKDLRLQVQLLKRQKRNTEAIIYSISDAVIVTDANDRLLMANEPAGVLFGFDLEKAALKLLDELVSKNELIKLITSSRKSKARHIKHELIFDSAENPLVYNCTISCIYDDEDEVCGTVAVLHDITREKEISQMKNDFVSHVSHELKTPLASITAYSEMLVDGEANDEKTRNEFYSIIQNQAQRLNRLIEDILNISRIESGLIKVNKEALSTALVVRDAVQMIKGYAIEKDITVEDQTSIVFDQVVADKDMISQVVINLLSNAVKYTPNGGKVTVNSEVDESEGVARVTVTDTGVGIPSDDLLKVFDKFYRVKANNKCAKGTGLGLNLVKQIIEKVHNGRVFVASEIGKGSSFGFELPLAAMEKSFAG